MPFRAATLVKSYFNLSAKTCIILAISSGVSTLLQTLTRSAAAIILLVLTSWSISTLFNLAKIASYRGLTKGAYFLFRLPSLALRIETKFPAACRLDATTLE